LTGLGGGKALSSLVVWAASISLIWRVLKKSVFFCKLFTRSPPSSAKRGTEGGEEDEEEDYPGKYCIPECTLPGNDEMVSCDGKCDGEWFHYSCVGLKTAPSTQKW
jgi:hypothetical protein